MFYYYQLIIVSFTRINIVSDDYLSFLYLFLLFYRASRGFYERTLGAESQSALNLLIRCKYM